MDKSLKPFKLSRALAVFVWAALGAVTGQAQQAGNARLSAQGPVAVEVLPSGLVAVLESKGGLLVLQPSGTTFARVKDTMGSYSPIDMTSRVEGNRETLLVSMYWASAAQTTQLFSSVIVEYDLQGNQLREWHFPGHIFRGMTVDAANQIMYLTDSTTPSVFKLSLATVRSQPVLFARVAGAAALGPITLDPNTGTLFVADVERGSVYRINIPSRVSKELFSSAGEPAALAFDRATHRLLIADAARKCVWQLDTRAAKPAATRLPTTVQLREPRGIAISSNSAVWLADFQLNRVFALPAGGKPATPYQVQ